MAASVNVHNLLLAVRTLAPGVSTGPGGRALGPTEEVTDNDIQNALSLTDCVVQLRAGTNPYIHDPELVALLTAANWFETTGDVALKVTMQILKLLTLIPEAQRIA